MTIEISERSGRHSDLRIYYGNARITLSADDPRTQRILAMVIGEARQDPTPVRTVSLKTIDALQAAFSVLAALQAALPSEDGHGRALRLVREALRDLNCATARGES